MTKKTEQTESEHLEPLLARMQILESEIHYHLGVLDSAAEQLTAGVDILPDKGIPDNARQILKIGAYRILMGCRASMEALSQMAIQAEILYESLDTARQRHH